MTVYQVDKITIDGGAAISNCRVNVDTAGVVEIIPNDKIAIVTHIMKCVIYVHQQP